jgi:hypothetical protein
MTQYAVKVKNQLVTGWTENGPNIRAWAVTLRKGGATGVKVVKRKHGSAKNPARKLTKAQQRARASRAAKQRAIVKAVKGLLKKTNPSAKITGARVVKLRDGVLKITPIKANRGRR